MGHVHPHDDRNLCRRILAVTYACVCPDVQAMLLAGSGVANVVYVNLNALVQLVDPSQAGLINSIHRSLIMAANTLVPALASHFDIGSVPSALAMHGQAMEASVRMAADGAGLEEAEPGLVETGAAEWPHPHAISRAGNLSLVFACVSVMCAVASLLFCTVQPADDVEETTDAKAPPPVPAKKPSTDVCATGIRSPDPPAGLRSRKHRAAAKDSVGDTATDSDVQPPRATTSWFRGFGDLASPRLRFAMLINILTLCVDEVAMVFGAWRITHADELGQSPAFLGMASGASAIMSFTVIMASGKIVDKLISLKVDLAPAYCDSGGQSQCVCFQNTILTLHVLRVVCLLVMGCSDAIQSICWPRNAQASAMVFAGAWAVHDALWHAYAAPASLWVGRGVIAHHEARAKEEGKVVTDGTRGKALARMFVIEKVRAMRVLRTLLCHACKSVDGIFCPDPAAASIRFRRAPCAVLLFKCLRTL